jgi:hypothetical protein
VCYQEVAKQREWGRQRKEDLDLGGSLLLFALFGEAEHRFLRAEK